MKRYILAFTTALLAPIAFAQQDINWNVTLQTTNSGGDYTPLWLSANKYGLSSLDKNNGYLLAGLSKPLEKERSKAFDYGYETSLEVA